MSLNIGIRLHDMAPGTLEERFRTAQEQGFHCVHLALSKTVPGFTMREAPALLTDDFAAEISELLTRYHLTCAVLGCYLQPADPRREEAEWILACYKAHFRFGRLIGATVVGTETPAAKGTDPTDPAIIDLMMQRARLLADMAADEGTTFAVEPVFRHIIRTPALAERLLEASPGESQRIILDAVNLLSSSTCDQAEAIVADGIHRLGDRVAVLHMKDCLPRSDSDEPYSIACGSGLMQYDALLRFNRERGGLPMTLENTNPENAVAARQHLEAIDSALDAE